MRRAIFVFGSLVVVFAGLLSHQLGHFQAGTDTISDTEDSGYEYYYNEDADEEDTMESSETKSKKKALIDVNTDPESITVLVNRKYRLDKDYVPADLVVPDIRFSFYGTYEKSYVRQVTATALETLFSKAEQEGVILQGVSGYRSYARQEEIYSHNVNTRGETTTNLVSANPGASEHQTGLAIDVSSSSVGCELEASFGDTKEGIWLAKNCHKYGFIIRYPKDKTQITGYSYEPWHIRYVGKKLATYLYKKNLTLEEYYQTTTKDNAIKEPQVEISDVETGEVDEPEMTSAPTPVPTKKPTVTATPKTTKKPKKKVKVTKKPVVTQTPATTKAPEDTQESVDPAPVPEETQAPVQPETPAGETDGQTEPEVMDTVESVE